MEEGGSTRLKHDVKFTKDKVICDVNIYFHDTSCLFCHGPLFTKYQQRQYFDNSLVYRPWAEVPGPKLLIRPDRSFPLPRVVDYQMSYTWAFLYYALCQSPEISRNQSDRAVHPYPAKGKKRKERKLVKSNIFGS